MNKIDRIIEIIFALMLVTFGANKFLNFMAPPKMNPEAMEFMMQIMNSGYIMPIIGAVFLFSGVSIIINKSKAFSLVLLAPIMLNIVLFHIRFGMDTITISAVLAALTVYLMVKNRDRYSLMCDCIHSCSKKKKK